MKDFGEIRKEAWRLLWKQGWFWRLLGGTVLLALCSQAMVSLVDGMTIAMGVFNQTALLTCIQEKQQLPGLTPGIVWQFCSSTALYLLIVFVVGGISAYGTAVLLVRSVDDNRDGWLKAAFGGFRIPLGLAWLTFLLCLVYAFWALLAAVPAGAMLAAGNAFLRSAADPATTAVALTAMATVAVTAAVAIMCVPFYRYRFLFQVKADNPDWGALRCLRECKALTCGYKWRSFKLDCSYWKIILAAMLSALAMAVSLSFAAASVGATAREATPLAIAGIALGLFATVSAYFLALALCTVAGHYIGVGQTILYREIAQTRQNQPTERQ